MRTDVNAFYMPSYKVHKGNHGMARTHGALQSDLDIPFLNQTYVYSSSLIIHKPIIYSTSFIVQLKSILSFLISSIGIHGNSMIHGYYYTEE